MDINKVSLENTNVGGKVVGNNDYSQTFNNVYESSRYFEELYKKFEEEKTTIPS